jgi:LAO/AO transport system kinase
MTSDALDRRRLAQRLSQVASATVAQALAAAARPEDTPARRIALTGPPGVGKSTLAGALAGERLRHPGRIGILAIDPSSPLTGGAILGDRIRMDALAEEPRIYIRSIASRTAASGLADNLPGLLAAFDAEGFAETIVETVGVGQAEHEIRHLVDTTVLVLMPGAGDQVQLMKSGIIETADIYVVNKADVDGAERVAAELRAIAKLCAARQPGWESPVILACAPQNRGIAAISAAIDAHLGWQSQRTTSTRRDAARRACQVRMLIERRVREVVAEMTAAELGAPIADVYAKVVARLPAR